MSLKLTRIKSQDEAVQWIQQLAAWQSLYQDYLNERAHAKNYSGTLPAGISAQRTWWFTHDRLRKAYSSMNTALKRGHLFPIAPDVSRHDMLIEKAPIREMQIRAPMSSSNWT
ncbi:hypothetical protein [Glutamicibacter sp. NPDC087344]|uniref:hypothetical protein n=1 Tax=Glutamicibacter sp. NPDC087344 TaxID=3363994 RepID=UPI0038089D1A